MKSKKAFLVMSPPGSGKTRIVLKKILYRSGKSLRKWNTKIKKTLIAGPNDNVQRAWYAELISLACLNNLIKAKIDTINLREQSIKKLKKILSDNGISHFTYVTYQTFENRKIRKGKMDYFILDEWHKISRKIYDKCDIYVKDDFINNWFIGGKVFKKKIFFVSATPLNPVLEKEEEDMNQEALTDTKYREKIIEAEKKALIIIAGLYGIKNFNAYKYNEGTFIENIKNREIGLEIITKSAVNIKWKLPKTIQTNTSDDVHEQLELKSIKNILNAEKDKWKSIEYAFCTGLIRTQRDTKKKVYNIYKSKNSKGNCFGYFYKNLYKVRDCSNKTATYWLNNYHTRLKRLVDILIKEKVLLKKKSNYDIKKKVLIFCNHQGVSMGLFHSLSEFLKLNKHDKIIQNTIRPFHTNKNIKSTQTLLRNIIEDFNSKEKNPYILITTDKFSESINLHQNCNILIHYELPWSPLRLYQRVGRLTRLKEQNGKLTFNKNVKIGHVIIPGSVEEERVNRLYRRLNLLNEQNLLPFNATSKEILSGLLGNGYSLHYYEILNNINKI